MPSSMIAPAAAAVTTTSTASTTTSTRNAMICRGGGGRSRGRGERCPAPACGWPPRSRGQVASSPARASTSAPLALSPPTTEVLPLTVSASGISRAVALHQAPASSRNRRTWASRSSRRCSSSGRRVDGAQQQRLGLADRAGQRWRSAPRPGRRTVSSSSAARHDDRGQPEPHAPRRRRPRARSRRSPAPGRSRPLDQRLCSRQVGHQAELGLAHRELARRRRRTRRSQASASWKPGADRVALHRRDRDEAGLGAAR